MNTKCLPKWIITNVAMGLFFNLLTAKVDFFSEKWTDADDSVARNWMKRS